MQAAAGGAAMELRQLKYFLVIAEEGSISAAARRLHVSQPPLSRQMSLLESECGLVLFHRGSRKIELTEAGKVLQRYALQMIDVEALIEDEMRDLQKGRRGVVRLGMISSAAGNAVFQMIAQVREKMPDLRLRICEGNSYEVLDMLDKEKVELAIVRTPFARPHLKKVVLRRDSLAAAGMPDCFSDSEGTKNTRVKVEDLAARPLIIYRRWENIIRMQCERESVIPNIFCVSDDARTALQMARSGLGIALVPQSALSETDDLLCCALDEEAFRSDVCLVSREDRRLTEPASSVQSLLVSAAGQRTARMNAAHR